MNRRRFLPRAASRWVGDGTGPRSGTLPTRRNVLDGRMGRGHIIAHELGHLVLGDNNHSPAGLMSEIP
jgi:hypothetical protein